MNRTKVNINLTPDPDNNRLLWYTVKDQATAALYFTGKMYILATQSNVTLDITDIVSNLVYKGKGVLTPTWSDNGTESGYQQPYTGSNYSGSMHTTVIDPGDTQVFDEHHYNALRVDVYSDSTLTNNVASKTNIWVYYHSIAPEDKKGGEDLGTRYTYYFDENLTPHLPKIATKNLLYGQLIMPVDSSAGTLYITNSTNANIGSLGYSAYSRVWAMDLYTLLNGYTYADRKLYMKNADNNTVPCLVFDECPKDYYLMWINPNGGFQSLGMNAVYTENYTNNFRITADDQKYLSNKSLNSNWKMKTDFVTEDEFKCIMTAGRSQYCLLYITEFDRVFYVNVTDTKIQKKTRYSENHKPFNIEFEVEAAESEFIII